MKIALHDNSLLDSLTAVGNAQATGYLDVPLMWIVRNAGKAGETKWATQAGGTLKCRNLLTG